MWVFWYALYAMRIVAWQPSSLQSNIFFVLVGVIFALATATSYRSFKKPLEKFHVTIYETDVYTMVLFHLIGLVGIAIYIIDFSSEFGGIAPMFAVLAEVGQSYQIREAAEEVTSVGFQLTYFGWYAAGLSAVFAILGKARILNIGMIIIQLVLNLLFIDRTRPVWILFCTIYVIVVFGKSIDKKKMIFMGASAVVASIGLFVLLGIWSGKLWNIEQLSDSFDSFFLYGTGGFAYIDHVMRVEQPDSWLMERTLYPLYKVAAALGVTSQPPPQVNEFYLLPDPTNVGTFLEPLYRDGGVLYMFVGVIGLAFLGNAATRRMLIRANAMTLHLCANIAFIMLMGFFTPKQSSLPIWLLVTIVCVNVLVRRGARRFVRTAGRVPVPLSTRSAAQSRQVATR